MIRVPCTPWHLLVASISAAVGCGFAYTFSTFSEALQAEYYPSISFQDIETIGIATTTVGFVTFSCGLLVDYFGATTMILFGGVINSGGWLVYGILAVDGVELFSPTLVFTGLGLFLTYGAACITGAVFGTLAKSFEGSDRTRAIGIAKAWVGIASGLVTSIFAGIFPTPDSSHERLNFLFFLSGACALFILLPFPFIRAAVNLKSSDERPLDRLTDNLLIPTRWRFQYLTSVTLLVIFVTVAIAFMGKDVSDTIKLGFSIVLIFVALLPWCMLWPRKNSDNVRSMPSNPSANAHEIRVQSPWDSAPFQMMQRLDMWLLFFCIIALQAGGVFLTTNLGHIVRSRSGPKVTSPTVVALFSAAQGLGRLFGGVISDLVVERRLSRPTYLIALTLLMAVAYSLFLIEGVVSLYSGVLLAGWCFGSQYPVMILAIAELYGPSRVASNYMLFDGFPGAVASLGIAKYYAEYIYSLHAVDGTCYGNQCFTLAYVGIIVLECLATLCAVVLAFKSRVVYRVISWTDDSDCKSLQDETAFSLQQSLQDNITGAGFVADAQAAVPVSVQDSQGVGYGASQQAPNDLPAGTATAMNVSGR